MLAALMTIPRLSRCFSLDRLPPLAFAAERLMNLPRHVPCPEISSLLWVAYQHPAASSHTSDEDRLSNVSVLGRHIGWPGGMIALRPFDGR